MKKFDKPVIVSSPALAPLDQVSKILEQSWETKILTHNGPLVQQLERKVNEYLKVDNTIVVTNGTIALQLAIEALDIKGEIITTPFSWIATVSAIKWQNCVPVFVDIEEDTFNIDPDKIEAAITPRTKAIMAVHVFSSPANTKRIKEIADKYNLSVIYDAAHAFGVNHQGRSIMDYGNISCTSFHATKLFNTGEGGACFATNSRLVERLKQLRFFGHNDEKEIIDDGLNGKMTEIHAAIGLANLPMTDDVIDRRKEIFSIYHSKLQGESKIRFQSFDPNEYNYSYLPVVLETREICEFLIKKMTEKNVIPRRYFYPSLNTIKVVGEYVPMPISEDISDRILCLPSNNNMSLEEAEAIADMILEILKKQ